MSFAIRAEGVGKYYQINQSASRAASLREEMTSRLKGIFCKNSLVPLSNDLGGASDFWALKDVSFVVGQGERIGVIGANGAGKSTLLKILSRVTSPSRGRIELRGKVASLLEVGTGFHPDLSGRENVYLSGAILGMPREEIRRKFDQIVEFSGVDKFIDTPVKHYSSGMYVRLAFSVSAWLDPDILILDEVLAVGDQGFQKKCEIRMRELTKEGRTVLFVSHSMAAINQMCQKALYLENGRLVSYGSVLDATDEYEQDVAKSSGLIAVPPEMRSINNPKDRGGTGEARVKSFYVNNRCAGVDMPIIEIGGSLDFVIEFEVLQELPTVGLLDLALGIDTVNGSRVFTTISGWEGIRYPRNKGIYTARVSIGSLMLRPAPYLLSVALINDGITVDAIVHCGAFSVGGVFKNFGIPWRNDHGAVRFPVSYLKGVENHG
jgi:ABC-type polysaccharide/polyol phosphate transport system ATPase subunit